MSHSSPHWSKVKESGTLIGMQTLLLVYRLFGRAGFRLILLPVMCYYYLTSTTARRASQQYIAKISPYLSDEQSDSMSSFTHFMHFGEMMLDKFLIWMGEITRNDVINESPELLNQLDNEHAKGGIIAVSHLGNIEICNALGQQLPNMQFTVLVNTHHAEKFNSLVKKTAHQSHVTLLQVNDISPATAILLDEKVQQGEFIIIAADRTPTNESHARVSNVNFLGAAAPMPQGAFILATLLKCPVYLMFCLKQQSQYHIYVELFSERITLSRKQREIDLKAITQSYANRLEYYCKKAPLQWFNFFPFWNDSK